MERNINSSSDIFKYGSSLRQGYRESSQKAWDLWSTIDDNLTLANELAVSVLASILSRSRIQFQFTSHEHRRHRAAIHAEFIKSVFIFEEALKRGNYGAASTLLRRELEAVNNVFAHRQGRQRDRKNPQAKPHSHLNEVYKQLSGIAHNSDRKAMEFLAQGTPANVDVIFDREFAEHLLQVHLSCLVSISLDLAENVRGDGQVQLEKLEERHLTEVLAILAKRGFLKFNSGGKSEL